MIFNLLEDQARRTPDAVALEAPGRLPLTYAELVSHIGSMGAAMNRLGAGCGDTVAIVLPNGPEMALTLLAVASNATAAPLNPAYRAAEFEFYFSDLRPKAVVLSAGQDSPARAVAATQGLPVWELAPAPEGGWVSHLVGVPAANCGDAGFVAPGDIALLLHTSGTTSRPKLVPLTQHNLCTSARSVALSLELRPDDRCLNVMPLFHIHGLIGVLLSSLSAGASVICSPGFRAAQFLEWMEAFHPTWYSAVPTMHQALLATAAAQPHRISACPLRFIRSCSAALPVTVMADLEAAFHAPVIEAYGMTEASHQMASNPLPPRTRKPGSVGLPAGTGIAILDPSGAALPPGAVGEVAIRGENVTAGYLNNPSANQSGFSNGWFRTGDEGYLDPDGYLFLAGRLKEIINRGGEKISPREVDDVLLQHAAVEQAVAFAVPHRSLGQDVAAAVVLRSGFTVTEEELHGFALARLAEFKVPRRILFVAEFPKGPTGKVQRIGMGQKLGLGTAQSPLAAPAGPEFVPPSTPLEIQLAAIWSDLLRLEKIGVRDDFFQSGGDSLLAAELIARIAGTWSLNTAAIVLPSKPTIETLAAQLEPLVLAAPRATSCEVLP